MQLRILSAEDVVAALPMVETIAAMKSAYAELSSGEAQVPLRSRVEVAERQGTALFMPAKLSDSRGMALKLVSVFPENVKRKLPTIHALVVTLDPETGTPTAILEGGTLTAIRTGAGSGAATDLLARPDASSVAILGAGVQARTQYEAVCAVRKIEAAWVYSPTREHSRKFAAEMDATDWAPTFVEIASTAADAVRGADIICTATTSNTPVFEGTNLQHGAHINAVGSFMPEMQELDTFTVQRSAVFVDSRKAALSEAGELIVPLKEGLIGEDHILAELGEVVSGEHPGRSDPDQITLFKSVGVAVQDAAAAGLALEGAEDLGLGEIVEL